MANRMTFKKAKSLYVYRYTMEHIPAWALKPCEWNGKFYAPRYRTDAEWFANTLFGKDAAEYGARRGECVSLNQTWPLGRWLDAPYRR